MKKTLFLILIVLILFSQSVMSQQPQGTTQVYTVKNNKPVQFKIYTPAEITLDLNYSRNGCYYSMYNIYKNDNLIFSTQQGNNIIPPKIDTAKIDNGFYGFKVGTGIINNDLCEGQRTRNNSELKITVNCLSGNCFMDPMILQMQKMQEEQMRRETQRMNRQNMSSNDIEDVSNPNSIMNDNFNGTNNFNQMNNFNSGMMGF